MSEPTFRIDVEHTPGEEVFGAFRATVYRLSDGACAVILRGNDPDHAVSRALAWVKEQARACEPFSVECDDAGNLVTDSARV